MAFTSKTIGKVGTILAFFCVTALLTSFASNRWVQSSGRDNSGFENLGLWSVCFKNYRPPTSSQVNRQYDGCWWVLNKELDDLRDFLIPSWFQTTQVLLTLCLILSLVDCILLIINIINCFPRSPYRHHIKRYLALIAGLGFLLNAILLTIAVLIFGIKSSNTGNGWLQNNDENYLSWSFGLSILAAILAIITGLVLLLQYHLLRTEKNLSTEEPKLIIANQSLSATNYQYSRGQRPCADNNAGHFRDPAYTQRYGPRDESKASLITPPTELFAVSGRGEVYVNNNALGDGYGNNRRQQGDVRRDGPGDYRDNQPRRNNAPQIISQRSNINPQQGAPNSRPVNGPGTRQLGRQGYPLRLNEPSFMKGKQNGSAYDDGGDGRSSNHNSIPEYVPRKKKEETATEDDSYDETKDSEKPMGRDGKKVKSRQNEGEENGGDRRKSRSKTRSSSKSGGTEKSRERSRSNSRSRKKTNGETDSERTPKSRRRSSKVRKESSMKGDSSDDDHSRSRSRSRRRRNSKSRSRSRDGMTSESNVDSDTGSTRSRSRRKRKEKELSRMDAKRRSASEDNLSMKNSKKQHSHSGSRRSRKRYDGNVSEDFSGSEYSHSSRRSRRKSTRQSKEDVRSKSRDNSDNESVRSNRSRSRRGGGKVKGTYSSYYEY